MPRILYRKIYDDDGVEMLEGSLVLVNGEYERIVHFDENDDVTVSEWHGDDMIYTLEKIPDDRYGDLTDSFISLP